jgi:hypothetical protein
MGCRSVDVSKDDGCESHALDVAIENWQPSIVSLLIERGADIQSATVDVAAPDTGQILAIVVRRPFVSAHESYFSLMSIVTDFSLGSASVR